MKIKITYVAELKSEVSEMKKRFLLPTVVAPRYSPPTDWIRREEDQDFDFLPGGPAKGYELTIRMNVYMMSPITSIESPTHPIATNIQGNSSSVEFQFGAERMDKDVIVNVEVSEPHQPRVVLETNEEGSLAAMVSLFPHFQFANNPVELVFILDQSGSMRGDRIINARNALQLFLRSMPEDCYFNIVGFGSTHKQMFPQSVRYDDSTLNQASKNVRIMGATLGGTELVRPLKAVFQSKHIRGYPRQVCFC